MKNLTFTVSGSATGLVSEIELSAQSLANHLQHRLNDKDATELQATQLTQEFVDKYKVVAIFHSGTFIGFEATKNAFAADEEFVTFKKDKL